VPWLEPDVNDALLALGADGVEHVVIVPIGFVSDHMEVMWDLDTQAKETAAAAGIRVSRAVAPGTAPNPSFISMWVDLIRERIAAETAAEPGEVPRAALGSLRVRPDVCAEGCGPAPRRPTGAGRPAGGRPPAGS
jgi:ferrochelatase